MLKELVILVGFLIKLGILGFWGLFILVVLEYFFVFLNFGSFEV